MRKVITLLLKYIFLFYLDIIFTDLQYINLQSWLKKLFQFSYRLLSNYNKLGQNSAIIYTFNVTYAK